MSGTKEQMLNTKKKRVVFAEDETHVLLTIWASEEIQHKFGKSLRHNLIWNLIAQLHRHEGYSKSGAEVKSKVNNLKTEYRNIKPKSGGATPTWPYFKIMHKILGERDCANDSLLDDSLSTIQASEDDFESNSSDNTPDGKVYSIDNNSNCNVSNQAERDSLNISVESPINTIAKQTARHTVNMKRSCGTNREVMRKIARPPRRKGSDENELIKTLIEAEKRYSQRLTTIEEQEKKAQDREDILAQSMNRFLTAFAVLAEKSANLGTTLLGPPAPPMATSQLATQGNSVGTSSAPHTITSASVGARSKPKKKCVYPHMNANLDYHNQLRNTTVSPSISCESDIAAINDEMLEERHTQDEYGDLTDYMDNSQMTNEDSQLSEFDFNGVNQDINAQDLIDDEVLPAVPWLQPANQKIKVHSIQKLVGKDTLDVNNLQPFREAAASHPLKKILQPLKHTSAKLNSSQELAIRDESPTTRTINECNTQHLVEKRTPDVENLPEAKKVIGLCPLKIISQPLQHDPPQIKSSAQLIHLKKAVQTDELTYHAQNSPLDTCNVLNTQKKASSMQNKKGFIYITLAKGQ